MSPLTVLDSLVAGVKAGVLFPLARLLADFLLDGPGEGAVCGGGQCYRDGGSTCCPPWREGLRTSCWMGQVGRAELPR